MSYLNTGDRSNEMSMHEFRRQYVESHYPNLRGYAYKAEIVSIPTGKEIMEEILDRVEWIEDWPHGHPILHLKDGSELFVQHSDDFPQPTSER